MHLLAATCPLNYNGDYVAPEMCEEQSLENLYAFSDRLAEFYRLIQKGGGWKKKRSKL